MTALLAHSSLASDDLDQLSIDEISRRLDNPLTSLWSLTFQGNYSYVDGDAIDGDRFNNVTFFQPALPIPVGENYDKIFIARPVFPYVRAPVIDPHGNMACKTSLALMPSRNCARTVDSTGPKISVL